MLGGAILATLCLWLQTVPRLRTGESTPPLSWTEQIALVRRHCDLVLDYYGAKSGPRLLRKFIAWGLRGFRGAARLRTMVQSVASPADAAAALDAARAIDPGPFSLDPEIEGGPATGEAA